MTQTHQLPLPKKNIYTEEDIEQTDSLKEELSAFIKHKPKQRIVLKIGSGSIVESPDENNKVVISLNTLSSLVQTICSLRKEGHQVCLVSSGAVAVGCMTLGLGSASDPGAPSKRALSAIGQSHLLRVYDQLFSLFSQHTAQILLSYGEFGDRNRYMNAASTIEDLLANGIVPIINENDAVAVKSMSLGDNDRLAGLVSCLINADWLFLLTDVQGVYTANPKTHPDTSKLISMVEDVRTLDQDIQISTNEISWGTGGMATKIYAGSLASGSGIKSVIMKASMVGQVTDMIHGNGLCGTFIRPAELPLQVKGSKNPKKISHKKWIASASRLDSPIYKEARTSSTIFNVPESSPMILVNEEAVKCLKHQECLKVEGIQEIYGKFNSDTIVNIFCAKKDIQRSASPKSSSDDELSSDEEPEEYIEVASGITNYSSDELQHLKGKTETDVMGGHSSPCVMDRQDVVFWTDRIV